MMFMSSAFFDAIGGMGFDYVASGHYANVIHLESFENILSMHSYLDVKF